MEVEWLGHSSFRIGIGGTTFVTDPAYSTDPNAPVSAAEVDDADFVLVGHGHFDHAADAVEVAEASDAPIVAVAELAATLEAESEEVEGIMRNPSAPLDLGTGVEVGLIEMSHSSGTGLMEGDIEYSGITCGFILDDGEQTLFYADDTGLDANLKVVGEAYDPDVAMLPISGGFVMDEEEAALATQWVGPDVVVPMHYDSLDAIPDADPEVFADAVAEQAPDTRVKILDQGDPVTIDTRRHAED